MLQNPLHHFGLGKGLNTLHSGNYTIIHNRASITVRWTMTAYFFDKSALSQFLFVFGFYSLNGFFRKQ